ncbi:MAG: phage holin family protein [Firmicutes bacterium]|nr:phage holin family protein [Bacillota bacterium]MDY5855613.1 phage holin family protein [Anaerovoracaceae bacterium]
MNILFDIFETAAHNPLLQLVAIAVVFDTIFGVIRAIRDHKFNSCVGIDGAIRKIGMIISLALLVLVDAVIKVNLIGFVPEAVRGQLGVEAIGLAEFFSLLYIAYEIISILKNMALCGLPVKGIWTRVKGFLSKYTTELPDDE